MHWVAQMTKTLHSLPGSTMSRAHKQLPILPFKIIILSWQLSLWVFIARGYPSVPLFTHYVYLHQYTPFKICKIFQTWKIQPELFKFRLKSAHAQFMALSLQRRIRDPKKNKCGRLHPFNHKNSSNIQQFSLSGSLEINLLFQSIPKLWQTYLLYMLTLKRFSPRNFIVYITNLILLFYAYVA